VRFLTSYALCLELFRGKPFVNVSGVSDDMPGGSPYVDMLRDLIVLTNPPQHTRLRRLLSQSFTPRISDSLGPGIDRLVNDLLDRIDEAKEVDLVTDYATPLPTMVRCQVLGAPFEDHTQVEPWRYAFLETMRPVGLDESALQQADVASRELLEMQA
jgi:cytochrome P450